MESSFYCPRRVSRFNTFQFLIKVNAGTRRSQTTLHFTILDESPAWIYFNFWSS